MELGTDEVRLLLDIGFVGIGEGKLDDAEAVIGLVAASRPGDVAVYVARALLELRRERPQEAVTLLRSEALVQHPDHPMLTAFLGMALTAAGYNAQARDILTGVAQQEGHEEAAALAKSLLEPANEGEFRAL